MQRYYTHLQNHLGSTRDETGRDLASDDEALHEAGVTAGGVLRDDLLAGHSPLSILLSVELGDGTPIGTITVDARVDRA